MAYQDDSGPCYVYEWYDSDNACLYVGHCRGSARARRFALAREVRKHPWMLDVVRASLLGPFGKAAARAVENSRIVALAPKMNKNTRAQKYLSEAIDSGILVQE